jgi:ankyrin repeat protein
LIVSEKIRGVDTSLKDIKTLEQFKAIIEWLQAPDPSVNHNRAYEKHGAGTCQWLYSDTRFLRWRSSPNDFIWLFGPSGCGKTVLSSTIIENLIKHDSRPVIFFYFDFNDQNKQYFENMVRSFLVQLYHRSPVAQSVIQSLHTSHADGSQQPSITRMESTLTAILEQLGGCKVVIDALDESKTRDRVVRWCKDMHALHDEVLALTIDFLESDLQRSPPFFHFSYPKVSPSGHECCALYIAAAEGLVRSCRYLIQRELASARLLTQHDDSTVESAIDAKNARPKDEHEIEHIVNDVSTAAPSDVLQFRLDNALVTASLRGHDVIVRDLLHYGAAANAIDQLNFQTPSGGSALLATAEYGHLEIVKMLVKAGASINHFVPGIFGTPLYAASKLGHHSVVEFLIEQKADPNILCGTCGNALLAAVQGDHADTVKALIACGADVNIVPWTPDLPTPLIEEEPENSIAWFNNPTLRFADQYGLGLNTVQALTLFTEMTTTCALVDMGADLESLVKAAMMRTAMSCGHGFSPLQSASSSGRLDIVEALIRAGAEINANGYHGTAFALAVQNGHDDIVDFLLDRANVNLKRSVFLDGLDWSSLESAVAKKQAATVEKILNHGAVITDSILALAANVPGNADVVKLPIDVKANADGRDIFGRTALQNAAVIGQETTVEMLLRYGACVDAPGPDADSMHFSKAGAIKHAILVRRIEIDIQADGLEYGTALQAAVYRGYRALVQILLAYGASIDTPGPKGDALTVAAGLGSLDMVELLIMSDKSVDHPSKGSTALITAAKKGHVDIVTKLLSWGVPPDIVGSNGTALNEAAGHGHEDVIRALLAGGADMNNDEGNGLTPLHIAVKEGLTDTVRLLLENNADVNKTKNRGSALGSAVESGEEEIVNLLLIKGALVEGNEGPQFLSPVQAAVFKGYEWIAEALLDAGADPNALDEAGLSPSPLRYACQVDREDIARLLLERGADVNACDQRYSLTPIQFCCAMGYESLVHTLVAFNADIDAPHPDGCALDRAVDKGHLSIVTYLLDHGANPNIDIERGNALQTAAFRGDVAMANLLLDHGADIDHSCGDTCPGWNHSALYQAVAEDHAGVTRLLVRRGARFAVAIDDATRSGDEVIMETLLALKAVSEIPGNRLVVEESLI